MLPKLPLGFIELLFKIHELLFKIHELLFKIHELLFKIHRTFFYLRFMNFLLFIKAYAPKCFSVSLVWLISKAPVLPSISSVTSPRILPGQYFWSRAELRPRIFGRIFQSAHDY